MSNKIVPIKRLTNIPDSLRAIADSVDTDTTESCTLIIGTDVFHLGTFDDEKAAEKAIFDMTYGIHKLMTEAVRAEDE